MKNIAKQKYLNKNYGISLGMKEIYSEPFSIQNKGSITDYYDSNQEHDNSGIEYQQMMNEIIKKSFSTKTPSICYNKAEKEDKTMSCMCVLCLGKEFYIASDSNATLINGETEYKYKKLFPFRNGVFGVAGTNSINTNEGLQNIGNVLLEIIGEKTITTQDFDNAIFSILQNFRLTISTSEIVLILVENNILHYKYYAFNESEYIKKDYLNIKSNTFHAYAINRATFEKGDNNFIIMANKTPKEALTKFIRFNEAFELFINNTRYIGGPIQMYKITEEEIKNLSEPPFDKF